MEPEDKVTRYSQVRELVERTYEQVTEHSLPGNVSISVINPALYRLFTRREITKNSDHFDGNVEVTYKAGQFPWYSPRRCIGKALSIIDPVKHSIVVVSNPLWIVVPDIFHGLGHSVAFTYTPTPRREMREVVAYLFQDELSQCLDNNIPGFRSSYLGIEPSGNFYSKCWDIACKFRPKVQLHGLLEKVKLALECSSLEELEKRLSEIF